MGKKPVIDDSLSEEPLSDEPPVLDDNDDDDERPAFGQAKPSGGFTSAFAAAGKAKASAGSAVSRSHRAGLQFPVGRVHRLMKESMSITQWIERMRVK